MKKIIMIILAVTAAAVTVSAAATVCKTKFHKKYITVCD